MSLCKKGLIKNQIFRSLFTLTPQIFLRSIIFFVTMPHLYFIIDPHRLIILYFFFTGIPYTPRKLTTSQPLYLYFQ
jgi:hypothetical protein